MGRTEPAPGGTDAGRVWFAQMLRGVACLLVVGHHLGYAFWALNGSTAAAARVDPLASPPRPAYLPPLEAAYHHGLTGGAFGVALFFLISGFVIPISLERLDWKRFLLQRVFRILPTFAAALGLTCLTMALYAAAHGRPVPFTARDVLLNLGLHREWVGAQSLDGVSWTLEVEVRFYLLCSLLAAATALRRASGPLLAALALTVAAYLLGDAYGFLGQHLPRAFWAARTVGLSAVYLPFMFVGTCFYNHFRGRWSAAKLAVAAGGLLLLSRLNLRQFDAPASFTSFIAVSYPAAFVVFAACYLLRDRLPRLRVLDAAAEISYPLYLTHGIPGYVLLTVLCARGMGAYAALAVTLTAAPASAWLLHRLVEVPGVRLGKAVASSRFTAELLGAPARAAVAADTPRARAA